MSTRQIVPPYIKEYMFAVVAMAERVYTIQQHLKPYPQPAHKSYPQVILVTSDPREAFELAKKYSDRFTDYEFIVDLVNDPFVEQMPDPLTEMV